MSYTPLEQKLRILLLQDSSITALVSQVVTGQLPQGMMSPAPPYRVIQIQNPSTLRMSTHDRGITSLAYQRIQFTAWCKGQDSYTDAQQILELLIAFLNNFDATSTNQFGSPQLSPVHSPNFVLNQRVTLYPNTLPPLYMGILDTRIYNREDL